MATTRLTMPVAVHLFLLEDGQVLLQRRCNTGFEDGNFSVPAGHLEGGETVQEAASRELLEETGLRVPPAELRVLGVMHRKAAAERIDFFLTPASWKGEPENREPEKCDRLQWFPVADLPANTVPYVRDALENCLKGEWFLQHGWESTPSVTVRTIPSVTAPPPQCIEIDGRLIPNPTC